jgi:predicted DsbA family dithiol-disulfide isomerase
LTARQTCPTNPQSHLRWIQFALGALPQLISPFPYLLLIALHRTYLGFLRLTKALEQFSSDKVRFTLRLAPYQLYPDFSREGEDKYAWYLKKKYDGNEERMAKFVGYMTALGEVEGITFDFHGTIANTLSAHRVLYSIQESEGPDAARKALETLYKSYFCQRGDPAGSATLTAACQAAGLGAEEARRRVEDENEGAADVKSAIREQAGNGVDSVPYVVVEGRRRDFTLVGAKGVEEYGKVLEQVAKEV